MRNFLPMNGDSMTEEAVAADLAASLEKRGLRAIDLARLLEVDKSTVSRWVKDGVPIDRVLDVERVAGIPRAEQRPDLAKMFGSAE